ncbi:MAG TPA: hypothetical protein VGP72_16575 [Planctomycetota bacterium]|jgi:hypothetical protein
MNWYDLLSTRYNQECYIYGKGPSLTYWLKEGVGLDGGETDSYRICINEAANLVPKPDYIVSLNECTWSNVQRQPGLKAVVQKDLLQTVKKLGWKDDELIVFSREARAEWVLRWSREEIAQTQYLYASIGSLITAVHFAWFLGSQTVNFVGIGGHGYAAPFGAAPVPDNVYEKIWAITLRVCDTLGVEPVLWADPTVDGLGPYQPTEAQRENTEAQGTISGTMAASSPITIQ